MKKLLFLAAAAMALTFSACKKDKAGSLHLHFEHLWDTNPFALNTAVTNSSGEVITPSKFRYYVSNIVLTKSDNSTFTVPESYYLVDAAVAGSNEFHLDDIPAGDYKSISFMLGVDSTRNVSGAQTGALDPAKDMFWSWNSGYIFLKFEGQSLQSPDSTVLYHIGGFRTPNIAYRTVSSTFAETVTVNDNMPELHYKVNVKKLFHNTSVATTYKVHMPGAAAVGLADNAASMFSLDQVHQ